MFKIYKKDLTGKKFNRLTIISYSHTSINSYWNCVCECGNKKVISSTHITRGTIKSCGCLQKEKVTTHGMRNTTEYKSWKSMIQRCLNPNNRYYKDYGGRGITICEKWINSFEEFYKDMGKKPPNTSLDRKDNNNGYDKENCRWATAKEQQNNKRNNMNITYNGKTQTAKQWSEELGIKKETLNSRIYQKWTIEKMLETKPREYKKNKK